MDREGWILGNSRILVGVSSPWASEKFITPIIDLAQRLDAAVDVAHVARLQAEDEDESDAKARGEETLKLLADALQAAGVEAEPVLLFSDDVAKALLNTAHARSCTLIVMGLTSRSLLKRLLARDVPDQVLRQADIPVLLFPREAGDPV